MQLALQLLRVASEALFLFEFNKTLGALVHGGRSAARRAYVEAEQTVLSHSNVPKRHINVGLPDGTRLHTLVAGELDDGEEQQQRTVVVLLHGHSMCGALFFAQFDALCDAGYTVYAPDLPGWGRSSRPRFMGGARDGVEYYSRRVLMWIDALCLNRFAIVGHSLGAYLAHEIAVQCPGQVLTLTLVAPAAVVREVDYKAAAWFCLTPQRFVCHGGLLAAFLFALRYPREGCYSRKGIREIISAASRLGAGTGDAAAAAMLRVCHQRFEAHCELPLVERAVMLECPVTIVCGDEDVLVSRKSVERLAQVLRDNGNSVKLEIIVGADHSPQISKAERFSTVLTSAVAFKA